MNYQELVQRLKNHDNDAFVLLYNDTKYAVYSMIYSIVNQRQTTEDLMQDTYMRMLEKINQYEYRSHFKTWLLTIAKNIALDYYRKHSKTVILDITDNPYFASPVQDNTENKMMSEMYLSILTQEEKQIVLLKIVDGLKHHEIAKIMNKPKGTIMWIYHEAIKKMQQFGKENE